MKVRIKENTIRLRLTKTEVNNFIQQGLVEEITQIGSSTFRYCLKTGSKANKMYAEIANNCLSVFMPENYKTEWQADEKVGFTDIIEQENELTLSITVEKDFVCLDVRDEDESDNYPNPKAGLLK